METVGIIVLIVVVVAWMFQMLKLTRENRIINSMILKVLLKKMEADGVKVDISDVQKKILENM